MPPVAQPALALLQAGDLTRLVTVYRDALRANQAALNRMNVYPVPDGDTGTNMALTVQSVVAELDALPGPQPSMDAVCKGVSHGSLMGARGNSGVILSQILRGLAAELKAASGADGVLMASALRAAATAAYGAVMKPVEGTILTVVRRTAEEVEAQAGAGRTALIDVLEVARAAAYAALAETPEMLPVLKQAGVVDAGGAGFCLLLDAALHVADGRPVPNLPAGQERDATTSPHAPIGSSDLRYEVMYLLEAADAAIPAFKDVWAGIGDSIVVVGGEGLWNCHIHTDDIGAAIEAAIDIGRPRNIRVTDLIEQVEEERWVREAAGDIDPPHVNAPVRTAVVAVANGDGIRRLFLSLRVQRIVSGGQSMNPSTQQLLEAVESAPAADVVILPNNKNIIPVAEQVGALTTKTVKVLRTQGIPEGLAAAMQYDPEGSAAANAAAMSSAIAHVVSAEVTRAVRDSDSDAGPIAEGDYLGIVRDGILVIAPALFGAVTDLLTKVVTDEHEIVTIIEGEGASTAETRRITEWLTDHRPGVASEVHHGGQPLYPYLFGIE